MDHDIEHASPPVRPHVLITKRQKILAVVLLALTVIMSGGALISQQLQQTSFENLIATRHKANLKAQADQSAALTAKLCGTLQALASLQAPDTSPGSGTTTTPGRVYEQKLQAKFAELATDLGCKK